MGSQGIHAKDVRRDCYRFEPELGDLEWVKGTEGLFKDWVLSESRGIPWMGHLHFHLADGRNR